MAEPLCLSQRIAGFDTTNALRYGVLCCMAAWQRPRRNTQSHHGFTASWQNMHAWPDGHTFDIRLHISSLETV